MRNHTFKPGDTAIITRCGNTRYIGAVVRIENRDASSAFDWIVEFLAGPVDGHELFTGKAGKFTHAPVWTWNLTPIRGKPADTDHDTKEPTQHDESDFRRFLINLQSSTEKVGA